MTKYLIERLFHLILFEIENFEVLLPDTKRALRYFASKHWDEGKLEELVDVAWEKSSKKYDKEAEFLQKSLNYRLLEERLIPPEWEY